MFFEIFLCNCIKVSFCIKVFKSKVTNIKELTWSKVIKTTSSTLRPVSCLSIDIYSLNIKKNSIDPSCSHAPCFCKFKEFPCIKTGGKYQVKDFKSCCFFFILRNRVKHDAVASGLIGILVHSLMQVGTASCLDLKNTVSPFSWMIKNNISMTNIEVSSLKINKHCKFNSRFIIEPCKFPSRKYCFLDKKKLVDSNSSINK